MATGRGCARRSVMPGERRSVLPGERKSIMPGERKSNLPKTKEKYHQVLQPSGVDVH